MDEELHVLARDVAATLGDPDRKQLRYNEIVESAKLFYSTDISAGVAELVDACDRTSPLYVKGDPMWQSLRRDYQWMLD